MNDGQINHELDEGEESVDNIRCLDSWDHVPICSWPLFKAKNVLRTLFQSDLSQPIQ